MRLNIFHMFICSLHMLFGEILVHLPFSNWIALFNIEFWDFFTHSTPKSLVLDMWSAKYFHCNLSFHLSQCKAFKFRCHSVHQWWACSVSWLCHAHLLAVILCVVLPRATTWGNWVNGTQDLSVFFLSHMSMYNYLKIKSLKKKISVCTYKFNFKRIPVHLILRSHSSRHPGEKPGSHPFLPLFHPFRSPAYFKSTHPLSLCMYYCPFRHLWFTTGIINGKICPDHFLASHLQWFAILSRMSHTFQCGIHNMGPSWSCSFCLRTLYQQKFLFQAM